MSCIILSSFAQESTLARESPAQSLLSFKTLPLTKVLNACNSSPERNPLVFWPLLTRPLSRWAHHWWKSSFKPSFRPIGPAIYLSQWQRGVCCDCHKWSILGGGCEPRMGHLRPYDTRSTRDLPHKPHMMWFLYTAPKLALLDMGSILKTICPLQNFPWYSHLLHMESNQVIIHSKQYD